MESLPNYQQFMEPCLKALVGEGSLHKSIIRSRVLDAMGLSKNQREVMLESGRATIAGSRISWALAYLKQAGAVGNPARGHYELTDLGQQLLDSPERPIDTKMLEKIPAFVEFRNRSRSKNDDDSRDSNESDSRLSPDEQLLAAAKAIRAEVQSELLDQLRQTDPIHFERVVLDVLRRMGYGVDAEGAARVTPKGGDEGIDGIIDQDVLGLDSIYVQAKRWKDQVSRPTVQGFAGALAGKNAVKGVLITTSTFSDPAVEYVRNLGTSKIVLIDGVRLSGLMYDYGIGVSDAVTITTRRIDTDYFITED